MKASHDVEGEELSSAIAEYCRHFQDVADTAPTMMWRFGPDGQCKFFNLLWLEYRGRTAEQERGVGWTEGLHPEDFPRWTSCRSAFEARQPFHLEFRIKRADTSYAWIRAHGVPQYLLDGSFVGYVGSLEETDPQESGSVHYTRENVAYESVRRALCQIAATSKTLAPPLLARARAGRRKQKTALHREALLECLDLSVTPIVVVDKRGQALYCNRAFEKFAAKASQAENSGEASKVTQWPSAAGQSSSSRENSASAVNCGSNVQAWFDSDSAKLDEDLRVSVQPLTTAGTNLTLFSIIDTSQENRTRLLEQAFLHDLVNAAGSIQMLIDLLTEGPSRQERAEYIKLLQVSINRLLAEIYHEKMMLESAAPIPSDFNVRGILTTLAEYYRKQPFARNCSIEIEKGEVESMRLQSDQMLLVRVLDNMLRNAIEATSQGGVVTMGCRQIDRELEFWVHNPNPISENVRTKIFCQSFGINDKETEGDAPEIKLLSELCGGKVGVCCNPEFGTTYSVRYPAAAETVSPGKRYRTKHAS
jgi:PAS domain S-box-containing protein